MMVTEQLSELFQQLRAELQVRDKPDLRAIAKLGVKPRGYGATEEPYADESFQIWEDLLCKFPDDLKTVHHLAIMHHARAFDLELSKKPNDADTDWEKSLELWHKLSEKDEFWDALASRIDKNVPNPFPKVREELPEKLLQVHFDIAFDENCKNYRRRQHIRLALDSDFSPAVKYKVRLRNYERVISHLPEAVWDSMTFDDKTLRLGIETIIKYLDLDENFLEALSELLNLLTKYQTGFVQHTNATDNSEDFQQKLKQIKGLGNTYELYIKLFEDQINQLDSKPNSLYNLILWHSRIGQALRGLKDYKKAASHYYRAFTAARQDRAELERQEEMRNEWLICLIMAAREYAVAGEQHGDEKARELLNSINGESQLPPLASMLRANTYMLIQEFELAEKNCLAALEDLRQERNGVDYEATKNIVSLETQCQELLEQIRHVRRHHQVKSLYQQATERASAGNFEAARTFCDQALEILPDDLSVLLLRVECYIEVNNLNAATADLRKAEAFAQQDNDSKALQAVSSFSEKLKYLDKYGGIKAFRLQQKAVKALNDSLFDNAIELLRQAIQATQIANVESRRNLKEELRFCQKTYARNLFQYTAELAEDNNLTLAQGFCDLALEIFPDYYPALYLRAQWHMNADNLEAASADLEKAKASAERDNDEEALKKVADLQVILQRLRRNFEEYGGAQAFHLQQRATEAFNNGEIKRSIKLLRQAINVAHQGGRRKLRKELGICLHNLAIQKSNNAIQKWQSFAETNQLY